MRIPLTMPDFGGNEAKYLQECIETGWVSSIGKFVSSFEDKFAVFCGTKYASSCSNGTAALHLALIAVGVKEGDEVIVPNLTFAATAAAVKYCGATPVLADVDKENWNLSPKETAKKITEKTKAIIPVHLYGNPCDMDSLCNIAEKNGIAVIEDAAEAHGAEYKGKKVGSIGNVGCFSFYGNKILTTGEGGMCITNNKKIIDEVNFMRDHGMGKIKYWHEKVGFNYRMTNIQAAIGVAQLERVNEMIGTRKKLYEYYRKKLKNATTFQKATPGSTIAPWFFPVLVENRDEIRKILADAGIETRPAFHPLSFMPPYKDESEFPNTLKISEKGLILPLHTKLQEKDIDEIAGLLK